MMHDKSNPNSMHDNTTRTGCDVCLVTCSGIKAKEPCKARDMYNGPIFKMAKAYAEKHARRWLIISRLS
jgi:hypothetical protein